MIDEIYLKSSIVDGSSEAEMHNLIQLIKDKPGKVKVNLKDNSLGDAGAKFLAEYLKNDIKITALNIAKNSISPEGFDNISLALKTNASSSLESIDVSSNFIFDDSGERLILAIDNLKKMKKLKINEACIGEKTIKALAEYIKTHPNLLEIQIKSNGIDGKFYNLLLEAKKYNPKCKIDIEYNNFDKEQEKILSSATTYNQRFFENKPSKSYSNDSKGKSLEIQEALEALKKIGFLKNLKNNPELLEMFLAEIKKVSNLTSKESKGF